MLRRPPSSTRTDTLFPYTTLFRAGQVAPISLALIIAICGEVDRQVGCKGCVQVQAAGNGVMASVTALKFAAGLLARIPGSDLDDACGRVRSEEHTSELQSLLRISYAVFCLHTKHTISP